MRFIRCCLAALAAVSFAIPLHAAEEMTREKRADIERLLEMTGALSLGKQMASQAAAQMAQILKQNRPNIPQKALDALPEEIGIVFEANMGSFKEVVIPVYHKYFTADEVKEMIRFYSTPLGQKTVKVLPSLMSETMTAGQKWGEGLGPEIGVRIRARMKKEGVEL